MTQNYYSGNADLQQNEQIQYSAFINDWTHAESNEESFDAFVDSFREPVESEDKKGPS